MYKYETHLHTFPVSRCGKASPRESVEFYKEAGYDGIFITNHFLDGYTGVDKTLPYAEQIHRYFADYEEAAAVGREIGIKVFSGVEITDWGIDFLVYGLDKEWYLAHPEILTMKKSEELPFLMENGALVIHAHPYRDIGHICLYPRCVHGVEIENANRTALENRMAKLYAENYGLLPFAGSDNHRASAQMKLAGMCAQRPIESERDFVTAVKNGEMEIFIWNREETV